MAYALLLIIILILVYGITQYIPNSLEPIVIGVTSSLIAGTIIHYVFAHAPQVY